MRQGMIMAATKPRRNSADLSCRSAGRRPSQPPLGLGEDSQRRNPRLSHAKVAPAQGEEDCTPRARLERGISTVLPARASQRGPSTEDSLSSMRSHNSSMRRLSRSGSSNTQARRSRVGGSSAREPRPNCCVSTAVLLGRAGDGPAFGAVGRQASVQFSERPVAEEAPAEDAARVARWPWVRGHLAVKKVRSYK